ncbi:hypothetical protein SAMN05421664_1130 [Chryseobacterium soldanellicola]|uniref:Uncharacterized protein n=1 Tax=Chryseobacterium soldanellicola TaxID=311333 RepID=A0A1H0ZXH8_9FLAO|nr:hypothetical protein [Chryseobacterium soldanellicola]SDQ32108.1 hypothetical protein SAMN05421664_1130 [Chryseobacterium soldanellicola]
MNKKFILRLFLLVAISIFLYSCRNDLLNEQHSAVNPNASKFRMVKLKDIPNVENFIYKESGRKDMKVPLSSVSISGKQDLSIGNIETSAIVEANYGTDVYYVFKVENINDTDAVYNLEVKKTNGQVIKAEIIEYDPKDGSPLDFQHFTGSVTSYSLDGSVTSTVGFNDGVGDCPPIPGTPGGNGDSGGTIDPGDVPPPNGGWYNGGNGPKDEVPWGDNPTDCTDLILDSHGNTIGWYDHCLNETHLNPIAHKTSSTGETDNLSADCNGDGSGVIITNPTTSTDPCEKAKTSIAKANVVYKNSEVKTKMDDILRPKAIGPKEWALALGQNANGGYQVTPAKEGDSTNSYVPTNLLSTPYIGDGHSHPGTPGVPSAGDLYGMLEEIIKPNSTFQVRFVYGMSNGVQEVYSLILNDKAAAGAFLALYPRSENYDPDTHGFLENSVLWNEIEKMKAIFNNKSTTIDTSGETYDSRAVGLAHIFEQLNAGMSIAKVDGNGNLKKINASIEPITVNGLKDERAKISKCP